MRPEPRRIIEPNRSAREFIDDLPLRSVNSDGFASPDMHDTNVSPKRVKRVAGGPGGMVVLLVLVAAFTCGWATAAFHYITGSREPLSNQVYQPDPEVTVTKTVEAIPDSCMKAIRSMQKYLESAQSVSASGGKQMDLMNEAFQAILEKDWKKLNVLRERQRNLEKEILPSSSKVIPVLRDARKELDQCLAESGSISSQAK